MNQLQCSNRKDLLEIRIPIISIPISSQINFQEHIRNRLDRIKDDYQKLKGETVIDLSINIQASTTSFLWNRINFSRVSVIDVCIVLTSRQTRIRIKVNRRNVDELAWRTSNNFFLLLSRMIKTIHCYFFSLPVDRHWLCVITWLDLVRLKKDKESTQFVLFLFFLRHYWSLTSVQIKLSPY